MYRFFYVILLQISAIPVMVLQRFEIYTCQLGKSFYEKDFTHSRFTGTGSFTITKDYSMATGRKMDAIK